MTKDIEGGGRQGVLQLMGLSDVRIARKFVGNALVGPATELTYTGAYVLVHVDQPIEASHATTGAQ